MAAKANLGARDKKSVLVLNYHMPALNWCLMIADCHLIVKAVAT